MKGFTREETRFSLCGLNCCLCSMHLGGYCPGCGGGSGNQNCAIAKCSLDHGGVLFCWECPEYPCSRYDGFDDGDSFVPHRNRQQDICNLSSGSDAPGASHPGSSSGSPWAWGPSSTVQRPAPGRCSWDLLLSFGSPFCLSNPVRAGPLPWIRSKVSSLTEGSYTAFQYNWKSKIPQGLFDRYSQSTA